MKRKVFGLLVLSAAIAALCVVGSRARGGDGDDYQPVIWVRVGDAAPAVAVSDDKGRLWRSQDYNRGRLLVYYFYLGDFMKNPIKQARAYSDEYGQFAAEGAVVVGVSGDTVETHQRFKETYKLRQTLLADPKGVVTHDFGVPLSGGGTLRIDGPDGKELAFERGCTPAQWTFVVGPDGKVLYKAMNTDPETDSRRALEFVRKHNHQRQGR